MIGAGSLVPPRKVLESGYLYVGAPVKQIRPLTDEEKVFLKYSAEHYQRLAKNHVASLNGDFDFKNEDATD
jgi:carbonic anhydrase/acetyltransferase-like protein (isoleucine patch superfamily)